MILDNPTASFLHAPGDPRSIRIELWAADFLQPTTFNAVIFGSGRVEVQSIEYQNQTLPPGHRRHR